MSARARLLLLALPVVLGLAIAGLLPGRALAAPKHPGRVVAEKAQCNRCHPITGGLPAFKREMHCVDCHTWILGTKGDAAAIAKQREAFPDWDRYLESIVHFTRLPDLGTLARRVRPGALRAYLDAPYDLRPHLEESMIPVRLSAREKDALVDWLAGLAGPAVATDAPDTHADPAGAGPLTTDRIAAGRETFVQKGCPTCHVFGNVRFQPGFDAAFYKAMGPAAQLAPNLRFARERLPRAVFLRFVQDPRAVDPAVTMPALGVTPAEAERLADFVYGADPELSAPLPAAAPEVPVLSRPVPFDEVYDEVLGKICVHCHMDPAINDGDGGAGNTGGLTYPGKRLALESYAGLARGLRRDGKRVSVTTPGPNGEPPLLLAALLRRHREAARDQRPAFGDHAGLATAAAPDPQAPGMPLGLPALGVAQLSLIKTWLAQGAPGPVE
ncbi:hypothetical protein L6V77_24715 [Myxococcota bacterium]|nr:hypothetical protein [Myxococcota bacterium]